MTNKADIPDFPVKKTEGTLPKGVVPCVLVTEDLVLIAKLIDRVQFQGNERYALLALDQKLQAQQDAIQVHSDNVTPLPTVK